MLTAFVRTATGITVAIGRAEAFTVSGEAGLSQARPSDLEDNASRVQLRVFQVSVTNEAVTFNPGAVSGTVEVAGAVVRPLNPDFTEDKRGYTIEPGVLEVIIDAYHEDIVRKEKTSLIKKTTNPFLPYTYDDGTPFYTAMDSEGAAPAASTDADVTCGVCGSSVSITKMRQHMGKHLLLERGKVKARLPCAFCGGESAQRSTDMSQVAGCPVWLEGGQPRTYCQLYGGQVPKWSMGPAKKVKPTNPCTNVPLECPTCPRRPTPVVHWKLNMKTHYELAHRGVPIPPALVAEMKTTDEELTLVKAYK